MLYLPSWHSTMYPLPFPNVAMQSKYEQVDGAGA